MNGVLVLATTNRREALDPALLRKGRFDHSVHLDYPTKEEVELALQGMLKDRAHDLRDLSEASQFLAGRPMSDVAWVVNEAARLTARAKRDMIEWRDLDEALTRLQMPAADSGASASYELGRRTAQSANADIEAYMQARFYPGITKAARSHSSVKGRGSRSSASSWRSRQGRAPTR
jgi:ATP-dependent Zn protease